MTLLPRLAPIHLPWILSVGLLAASAWVIAGLVWTIAVPGHTYAPGAVESMGRAPAEQASPSTASDDPVQSGFARSADFAPFGSLQKTQPEAIEHAPDTRLSLELIGVLATGQGRGSAIISSGRSNVALYHVGDTIGNQLARLHQVHPDRVILEREGQLEMLRLPRGEDLRVGDRRTDSPQRPSQPASSPAPVTASVSRSRWLEDPEQAMNSLRAQPVMRDGTLVGIRVTPTRNQREFERAGLQEGDIITSVEGQQIRDISDPEQILSGLDSVDRVNITIERDGQTLPLTIELTE
ncbi:type II secretion system protein GspC [Thioalkalivibrio sp. ALE30]|uniref:type II secretion system protein GspC n=1 Tax=Thioalkalivibrio sp. ALE30 TaxID=1158181 RepID=UPI000373D0F6|nr:type II secretion system protein GspC [Thioalkalivibrio sp. ALE30]